jgi:hypothetical protein
MTAREVQTTHEVSKVEGPLLGLRFFLMSIGKPPSSRREEGVAFSVSFWGLVFLFFTFGL